MTFQSLRVIHFITYVYAWNVQNLYEPAAFKIHKYIRKHIWSSNLSHLLFSISQHVFTGEGTFQFLYLKIAGGKRPALVDPVHKVAVPRERAMHNY